MAKLPGYYDRQVTRGQVKAPQITNENNLGQAVSQFAQGVSQLGAVQAQMQAREARDYVINNQNKTTVALAQEKLNMYDTASTGSEYTEGVSSFIETQKAAALENSPTPKAAEATGQYYDALMAKEMENSIGVAAQMNATNTANAVNESLEIGLNQTYRDPSTYKDSLANAEAIIDTSDLAPNVKDSVKQQYQEKLMTQQLLGVINQDPRQAVKDIESGKYDALDPSSLNQISSSAKAQSLALDKQDEQDRLHAEQVRLAEQSSMNSKAQSDLEIGISRGELGYVEIEKSYSTGTITPEKRTQLVKQVDARIEKMNKTNKDIINVSAAIEAGTPLDYRNTDHKSAVDSYYANMPIETRSDPNAIALLVKSTKIIPSSVETQLNAGLKGNTEQVVASSDLVARMNEQAPNTVAQLPQDTKAMGMMVSRLVSSGVNQAKAVELSNNAIYNTTPELKEVLKLQLNQKNLISKKQSGFSDAVNKISPSFWKPDRTDSMDRMEANYNYVVDQYYVMTHDIDAANELAATDISEVWGSTWVNGKEVMSKYPVEKMYGNGEETPWIYKQLKGELKSLGIEGKSSLQADSITSRETAPSYIIMNEQDGVMVPLMINGAVQRYTPDFSITPEKVEAEKQKQSSMEQARRAESYVSGDFRYKTEYGVSR